MSESQRVSLIAPCRNERDHVDAFCDSALAQQLPPGWQMELLVADGASDDGTRARLDARAAQDARLHVIGNPGRIVSTGLNAALAVAGRAGALRRRQRGRPVGRTRAGRGGPRDCRRFSMPLGGGRCALARCGV